MFQRVGRDGDDAERWVSEDLERILAAWRSLRGDSLVPATVCEAVEAHHQRLTLLRR